MSDRNDWLAGYAAARAQAAALVMCPCPEGRCFTPASCSAEDAQAIRDMQPEPPADPGEGSGP